MVGETPLPRVPLAWLPFRPSIDGEREEADLRHDEVKSLVPSAALAFIKEEEEVDLSGTVLPLRLFNDCARCQQAVTSANLHPLLAIAVCGLGAEGLAALAPALVQLENVKRLNFSGDEEHPHL